MRKSLAALVVLLAGLAFVGARQAGYLGGLRTAPALVVAGPPVVTVRDTLRPRETLSDLFERRNVRGVDWAAVAQAVRNFDPARVRAGMVFSFRQRHGEDEPHAVVARVSNEARLHLDRTGDTWAATVENIPWRVDEVRVAGVVRDNLYEAMDAAVNDAVLPADARRDLVWGMADVYDWTVDFTRDIRDGDRFEAVAERLVSSEGEVRYGRVMAVRLDLAGRPHYAFRLDDGDRSEFYDDRGNSMRGTFLRAPLQYRRISSRFSSRRLQPILRVYRAHLGTDFAAAYGTPVRSVSEGTVVFAGREGGYGNLIEIRHPNGYRTRYGHLSGFAPGVRTGARVGQGETIGFVGSSGLSTGPHLHYEVRTAFGKAVNPKAVLGVGTGAPIAAGRRTEFDTERQRLMRLLDADTLSIAPRAD